MKIVTLSMIAVPLLAFANFAEAKSCAGDPTALSRSHFASGSFDGVSILTLPNGCKMTCQPGDSSRGTKRHCKWA